MRACSAPCPWKQTRIPNPVGACYGFVDGYIFVSVRQVNFQVGGETVANMPFMAIADAGVFPIFPGSCSSGGGTNENSVQAFGANGVMGIGVTPTDCGSACNECRGLRRGDLLRLPEHGLWRDYRARLFDHCAVPAIAQSRGGNERGQQRDHHQLACRTKCWPGDNDRNPLFRPSAPRPTMPLARPRS